jgi:ESF2/ABP1 family protein
MKSQIPQHEEDKESDEESDDENELDVNDDVDEEEVEEVAAAKPKKVHRLSLAKTEDFNEKLRKRGVLYVARTPPRMTPTKIKALLSEFGEVTRVYLVEEDATVRKRRKKMNGGSGGKRYLEGWVEFASKKIAKNVALNLNNTTISNHKRNPHYGEKCTVEVGGCL